jgi:hypothetical protein
MKIEKSCGILPTRVALRTFRVREPPPTPAKASWRFKRGSLRVSRCPLSVISDPFPELPSIKISKICRRVTPGVSAPLPSTKKLSPICATPVTVMVLRVVDAAQAVTGADVRWPRWRLIQHHRDRLLLLGLRCRGEIVRIYLRPADQALERITRRHTYRRDVVRGLPPALESVGDGCAHCLNGSMLLRYDVAVDVDRHRSRR